MKVHQVLSGAGPFDAVTNEALEFRRLFTGWGWSGDDVAWSIDPRMNGKIRPLAALDAQPDDVLVVHYSAYAPKLRALLDLPCRKLLISHNVTPARWLWDHEPMTAVQCALGRAYLARFAAQCDAAVADSTFNAEELKEAGGRDAGVLGIIANPRRLGPPRAEDPPPGPPTVLFVGRLMPHKRQDELIRVIGHLRREHAPDARLMLVGEPLNARYGEQLRALADAVAPGAVSFERGLTAEQLGDRYRAAHVFLCLSEHEGFCIPVLEALYAGVPVVARPEGAVPEVASDAAVLVADRDPAVITEALWLALTDGELRAELRARGARRAAELTPERVGERLRAAVEALVA